jgi:hypothetical protein
MSLQVELHRMVENHISFMAGDRLRLVWLFQRLDLFLRQLDMNGS